MKVLNVRVRLDDSGWAVRTEAYELEEKGKSFVGMGRRITKDKFGEIEETAFFNNHKSLRLQTWCFDGQQQAAVTLLSERIKSDVIKMRTELSVLEHNIANNVKSPY